jgi:hypothetical protein
VNMESTEQAISKIQADPAIAGPAHAESDDE